METHRWLPVRVAAKLAGLSYEKALAAAHDGRFGPAIKRRGGGEWHVSSRGIELATGFLLDEFTLDAAAAAKHQFTALLMTRPCPSESDPIKVGADVVRTPHKDPDRMDDDD
ncbi:MAG: hypothetical protein L0Z50_33625 [Verrucomicrobiales bacterium]|nr:hypothetical protein [Verrucomicrobiales bacterium]